ncbi:MAG: hypothetical protein ABI266_01340 [Ginsengibacter sp.]
MIQSKNLILALGLFTFSNAIVSCNSHKTDKGADSATVSTNEEVAPNASSTSSSEETTTSPANQVKTYKVTFSPDNAIIGKKQEALIQLTDANAISLSDPDGKDMGIEFSFKLKATNKSAIGSNDDINLNTDDWRLLLDNGEKISNKTSAFVYAKPESTATSDRAVVYIIPAGKKAKSISLFYNDTRAEIGLTIQ